MTQSDKNKIPVREGLWSTPKEPGERPQLIAARCQACGEIFFPLQRICNNCQSQNLEEIKLSQKGKIYSHTVIMQRPATFKGPVPYAIGYVELPEKIKVETLFTGCNPNDLKPGADVELVIEKLHEDAEGNEVMAYMFKPMNII